MTITVDRKDIMLRQQMIDNPTLAWHTPSPRPGKWEAQFSGRLSSGEYVESAAYVDAEPAVALAKLEIVLKSAGWGIKD